MVGKSGTDKPERRAVRLDVEVLPDEWRADCSMLRPDLDAQATFDSFADYWRSKAGADACKLDWRMTWRNWCRNTKYAASTGYSQRPVPVPVPQPFKPAEEVRPATSEERAFAASVVRKARGLARQLSDSEFNVGWAHRLKARAIAGEHLLPCQIKAYTEALADIPPTEDEKEAAAERAAMMTEDEPIPDWMP